MNSMDTTKRAVNSIDTTKRVVNSLDTTKRAVNSLHSYRYKHDEKGILRLPLFCPLYNKISPFLMRLHVCRIEHMWSDKNTIQPFSKVFYN